MSISPRLKNYLEERQVSYNLIPHTPTDTAFNSAKAAHIPAQCVVKGVLLNDQRGYMLAAIAATRSLNLGRLNTLLGRRLRLTAEAELAGIFSDCIPGAVPALGEAYGIPTMWDSPLAFQPGFYLEAGNHCELVRVGYFDFMKLMNEDRGFALSQ